MTDTRHTLPESEEEDLPRKDPKYVTVKNYLMQLIAENKDAPLFKLPSENRLSEQFGVSRITSKYAVTLLEQENLVYRVRGKGTFVRPGALNLPRRGEEIRSVGLLIPDIKSKFTTTIVDGVENSLKKHGYTMLLSITEYSQDLEQRLINQLLNLHVSGLVIYPADNQIYNSLILKLILNKFPLVFVDRILPGVNINNVTSPHTRDCSAVVNYLIQNGHRKIGIVSTSPAGTTTVQRRLHGYEKALFQNDIPVEKRLMCSSLANYDPRWEEVLTGFVKQNPDMTAVVAACSDLGYKLFKILRTHNIRMPEDISVIIYDEEYTDMLQFMNINPTRVEQDPYAIGYKAVDLLLRSIADPEAPPEELRIPSRFIIGNTTRNIEKGPA